MTDLERLAVDAYTWGYPLVRNMVELDKLLQGRWPRLPHPQVNAFSHVRDVADASTKFVSPNVDVLFSVAVCDVSNGPIILSVEDTLGRYYVLQFIDPWTHNFAYVGRRSTGTEAGEYLITAADYDGLIPDSTRIIRAPAPVFAIIGRVAIDDEHDLAAVHAIQDGFQLRPLVASQADDEASTPNPIPQPDPLVRRDLIFWERLRVLLAEFEPPSAEHDRVVLLEPLGLLSTMSPYVNLEPATAARLRAAEAAGIERLNRGARMTPTTVNGWGSTSHSFDYNLDYFELGTCNELEWKVSDRSGAQLLRATSARLGLWGNHGYEAAFFQVWVDADGQRLTGTERYEWTLPAPPPAAAFWSLTMYGVPDFHLVVNPINRYCVSGVTPGLHVNDDGSLTIAMQREQPSNNDTTNWLPSPAGEFRPLLSIFEPLPEAFDPAYQLPPIRRIS